VRPTPPLTGVVFSLGSTVLIRPVLLQACAPKHGQSWPTGSAMACLLLYCGMVLQCKSHALEWLGNSSGPLRAQAFFV
jgi:hypothetical protein